jgi:hypothetical protein
MPRFDGTGPQGLGPMTGRGEGYCALVLPSPGMGRALNGYAGLAGRPLQLSPSGSPARTVYPDRIPPTLSRSLGSSLDTRRGRGFGWRRGWGGGRWR